MQFSDISLPEIYTDSDDFRFFIQWFSTCLEKLKFDTENFMDLYDPLRCPSNLLWCLADTMGFKYDSRVPTSYNRFILLYFMSMIRLKGSKDGITLAAEVNLAQFPIIDEAITGYFENDENGNPTVFVKPREILKDRLENTNIPVQSVSVIPHTDECYIEVVYFSNRLPTDCCLEYVRPIGMYLYQMTGVKFESRTKISVDARLTNMKDVLLSIGPTHVGHYSREDYARLQEIRERPVMRTDSDGTMWKDISQIATNRVDEDKSKDYYKYPRDYTNYRNSAYENGKDKSINPGARSLYSLQLANNDHIVNSLIRDPGTGELNPPDKIFSIGYNPIEVTTSSGVSISQAVIDPEYADKPLYNLRYDREKDRGHTEETFVTDPDRISTITAPKPAVNPVMLEVGDAITHTPDNTLYSESNNDDNQKVVKK